MPSRILFRIVSVWPSTIEILSTLTQTSGCGDLERVSPAAVFSTSVRPIASISIVVPVSTIAWTSGSAVRRIMTVPRVI